MGNHVLLAISEEVKTFFLVQYIIRFSFCGIQNNQGRGRGYQPQP